MVDGLVVGGRIRTSAVERAFRAVPRHLFLPDDSLEQAYQDEACATKWQDGVAISSASQPSMMAIMLEQLALRAGHRVLEIGAGTGYNAALMSELVGPHGSVVALDIDDDLTQGAAAHLRESGHLREAGGGGITLATRDGALGYPELAPYDRIVLTVGSWDIQPAWWRQLVPGGRLLLPLSVHGSQLSVALDLLDGPVPRLDSASVRSCAFVRLRGQGAGPDPSRVIADGLAVQAAAGDLWDVEKLLRLLDQPEPTRHTGVRLRAIDLWDGLGLWVTVHEPDACRFLVGSANEWYRALALLPAGQDGGTVGLVGEDGLAVLEASVDDPRGRRYPVSVRAYGPGGGPLADRLAGSLRQWVTAGQPSAAQLRIRAFPGASTDDPVPDDTVPDAPRLVKQHSWLELTWPGERGSELAGSPDGAAPKLAR
jgi:protein-L-isoaspartate(D-aspartate) O-methyltransferase